MKNHLAIGIEKTEGMSQYDAYVKELLSDKQVLARIMKYTIREFREFDIDTIIECIEEEPEVASHPVFPGRQKLEKITGMNTESKIIDEGTVTFDIRFYARIPGRETVKIIINIEAQKDYYVGYSYGSRGIFYCARMISEQKDTEFTGDNYDDIKKVYSIWICMNSPRKYADTISMYSMNEEQIYGEFCGEENYDLLSVILIRLFSKKNDNLRKKNQGNELIKMLDTLLSHNLDAETKKRELEKKFGMKMEKEGVMDKMCNLSELIWEEAEKSGEERGMIIGEKQGEERANYKNLYDAVNNVMKSLSVPVERACEILMTSVEDYNGAKAFLGIK